MGVTMLSTAEAAGFEAADLTYQEVGATREGLPAGYHHLRRGVVIGSGNDSFERASSALFSWRPQLRSGLRVRASAATAGPGVVVVLTAGAGPLRIIVPCRVVYVVDEPDRRGFAYGTLPGHPESGEECFLLQRRADGTVAFTVTAFSRPATPLARAAGPLGRAVQRTITRRYLRAFVS